MTGKVIKEDGLLSAIVAAAEGGYEAPGVAEFWQPLIGDGAFAVTRAMIVFAASVLVLSLVLLRATRKLTLVPSRGQMLTEASYGFIRNSVARDIIGSKDFLAYVPLLFTLFVVILTNNVFSIVPFIQFPTMSRVAFPYGLALIVFLLYHVIGLRKHGAGGWVKKMALPPGVPVFVLPLLFVLELVTYFFTRPVTLALRLFGNMFAGHILLLLFILGGEYLIFDSGNAVYAVAGGVSLIMGFVMTLFELLVQVLQAYIFVLLSALYIADALSDEH